MIVGKLYKFIPSDDIVLYTSRLVSSKASKNRMLIGNEYIILLLEFRREDTLIDIKILWDGTVGWTTTISSDTFEMIEND